MDIKNLCINCMKEKQEGQSICPHCGFDEKTYAAPQYVLPPYTVLNGKYLLGKVLGMGGFGITYLAMDLMLRYPVAIKEYYVQHIMYRNVTESSNVSILNSSIPQEKIYKVNREKFENEARTLATLADLPGIVRVLDLFTESGTVYIVMEYLSGQTMKEYVREKSGRLSVTETREKLNPIMTSLQYVHDRNIIHRDISPDNMKVLDSGIAKGQVKLFDFGGARQDVRPGDDARSAVILKKDGFTPIEQIAGSKNQGTWTDVYAMAATIYYCICGQTPVGSSVRVADPDSFRTPGQMGVQINKKVEDVLLKGMAVQVKDRYQTMKEFQEALENAGWGREEQSRRNVWPFVVGGCLAAVIGVGIFVEFFGHNDRKEEAVPEIDSELQAVSELIDNESDSEVVSEAMTETETETEDVTETVTEKATEIITEVLQVGTETENVTAAETEAADVRETEIETETIVEGEWAVLKQGAYLWKNNNFTGFPSWIKSETQVKVLEKGESWYRVSVSGKEGYVRSKLVSKLGEEQTETVEEVSETETEAIVEEEWAILEKNPFYGKVQILLVAIKLELN